MDIFTKTVVKIVVSIFLVVSISCRDNAKINSTNGIWTQEGYGRIIQISDSTYTYFNITENSCLPLVGGKLKERFKIVRLKNNKLVLNPGGIVDYHFVRSGTLPVTCNQQNAEINKSAEKNFGVFWNTFNEHYAFFEKRNINWTKVKEKYLPIVKTISSDKELYKLFIEILQQFDDGHIKLDVPYSISTDSTKKQIVEIQKSKSDIKANILNEYVSDPKSYNNGVIQWGDLKNSNIGYILISDMNDFSSYVSATNLSGKEFQEAYDKNLQTKSAIERFSDEMAGVDYVMTRILKDLSNSKSILIDLRFNNGGYETVALKLLSYFVDRPKHILSIKSKKGNGFTEEQKYVLRPSKNIYDGPVFLLTSNQTASAAEIFALGALAYPKIKSYGSSTAGIFSEILWKNLPNGWEFSLSNEIYSDPQGNEYETIGVPVNYNMDYPENINDFYDSFYVNSDFKDLTIEKIWSSLKKK